MLYGSEGGAILGSPEAWNLPSLTVLTELKGFPAELSPALPEDGHHAEAVGDFLAKVQGGSYADHHGEHLLTRSTIVEAAYRSAQEHREVVIDPL